MLRGTRILMYFFFLANVCIFEARIAKQTKVELNINCITPKLLYLNIRYYVQFLKHKAMNFFRRVDKSGQFKPVTAFDVAANAALFFHGLQFRFGMDEELVRLSCQAVDVCTSICERLKVLEK